MQTWDDTASRTTRKNVNACANGETVPTATVIIIIIIQIENLNAIKHALMRELSRQLVTRAVNGTFEM